MSQQQAQRDPLFPAPAFAGTGQAQHQDPGDMLNGLPIPGKAKRKEKKVEAKGATKRLLLCPICEKPECGYTREVSS
jgi:hypothetical protein